MKFKFVPHEHADAIKNMQTQPRQTNEEYIFIHFKRKTNKSKGAGAQTQAAAGDGSDEQLAASAVIVPAVQSHITSVVTTTSPCICIGVLWFCTCQNNDEFSICLQLLPFACVCVLGAAASSVFSLRSLFPLQIKVSAAIPQWLDNNSYQTDPPSL